MDKDGGLDDLFGALGEDEPGESPESQAQPPTVPDPHDASAALYAAFIEAATAPDDPTPEESAGAPETVETAKDGAELPDEEPPASEPDHPALLPPLTRRQLRERRIAGETDAIGVVPAVEPDTSAASAEPEAAAEPEIVIPAEPEDFVPFVPVEPHDPAAETAPPADAASPDSGAAAEPADGVGHEPVESIEPVEPVEPPVDAELAALTTAPATTLVDPSTTVRESLVVSGAPRQQPGGGFPIRLEPAASEPPRRRPWWLFWAVPLIVIVLLIGYVGVYLFTHIKEPGWNILGFQVPTAVEEKVRELLGWEIPNDYEGTGNGVEAVVTIFPGDFGDDVAIALHAAGVTKTFDAFHDLLLELAETGEEPSFLPGNYRLQQEMSARAALDALLDPANRLANRVIIPEGSTLPQTLAILAGQTGIPIEEFEAAAADLGQYGLPPGAVSLEGYLFPAGYDLDGTESAVGLLQRLVAETFARLDALGVAVEDRNAFLTLASIVQMESGPDPADPPKIARVFQNRIDQGIMLESDATTTYGTCVWGPTQGRPAPDTCGSVFLYQADIDDATNPYNTRAVQGLPPGPIGMPGQAALDAVANPAEGPWLFFVTVNLATGETVFSETVEQHDAAVEQLYAWCEASDENASYCA